MVIIACNFIFMLFAFKTIFAKVIKDKLAHIARNKVIKDLKKRVKVTPFQKAEDEEEDGNNKVTAIKKGDTLDDGRDWDGDEKEITRTQVKKGEGGGRRNRSASVGSSSKVSNAEKAWR